MKEDLLDRYLSMKYYISEGDIPHTSSTVWTTASSPDIDYCEQLVLPDGEF